MLQTGETNQHQMTKHYLKLKNYLTISRHLQKKRGKRSTTIAENCTTLSRESQQSYKGRTTPIRTNDQWLECEWIRNVETTTSYDQGQKAQQLQSLNRIMNSTWNNLTAKGVEAAKIVFEYYRNVYKGKAPNLGMTRGICRLHRRKERTHYALQQWKRQREVPITTPLRQRERIF
eukprot:5889112-Amphidinium_carterae.1